MPDYPDYESMAKLAKEGGNRRGALKKALESDDKLLAACIENGWFMSVVSEIAKDRRGEA